MVQIIICAMFDSIYILYSKKLVKCSPFHHKFILLWRITVTYVDVVRLTTKVPAQSLSVKSGRNRKSGGRRRRRRRNGRQHSRTRPLSSMHRTHSSCHDSFMWTYLFECCTGTHNAYSSEGFYPQMLYRRSYILDIQAWPADLKFWSKLCHDPGLLHNCIHVEREIGVKVGAF